jgi:hypothetical protein
MNGLKFFTGVPNFAGNAEIRNRVIFSFLAFCFEPRSPKALDNKTTP